MKGLNWPQIGPNGRFCDYGNQPVGSIMTGNVSQLNYYQLLSKDLVPRR